MGYRSPPARCSIKRASQHGSLYDAANIYGLSGNTFHRESNEEAAQSERSRGLRGPLKSKHRLALPSRTEFFPLKIGIELKFFFKGFSLPENYSLIIKRLRGGCHLAQTLLWALRWPRPRSCFKQQFSNWGVFRAAPLPFLKQLPLPSPAMDGVPFALHPKFESKLGSGSNVSPPLSCCFSVLPQ